MTGRGPVARPKRTHCKADNDNVMRRSLLLLGIIALALVPCRTARSEKPVNRQPLVRIAELEIEPAELEAYKAALKEGIAAAIRVEPGVLSLLAVAVKDHPTQIRIFETYADRAAYESHLQTPHFLKYKSETQRMVKSLKLIEAEPILLGAKNGKP